MKIGDFFIRRPVMTSMIFVGVILFGIISWSQLPQELFPNISVPQLVVITKYPNAAPEEIENLITKPIEEAVGTVPNLKRIRSLSREGLSAVTLEFGWGTDMGFAHLSTREKLDRMKDRLPQEAEEPIIKRMNPFSKPVLIISVTGDLPLADMTELCKEVIKKKLDKTDGVGSVTISGGQKREILVEVDRGRLDASHVSLPMVVEALKNANYDYPAGVTQGKVVEYLVRTHGRFKSVEDIGRTIVQIENPEIDPVFKWKKREDKDHTSAPREQRLIPLADLAEIKWSLQDKTSFSRYNGKENISITIQKQAEANTVKVSEAVKKAIEDLKPSLPSGMTLSVIYDEANYIVDSLSSMRNNVILGGLLAFFVLFYFLGNFRDATNVGLTIPIATLGTLIMMFATGISINMLTLAGLALAVGSISDCGVVATENVVRHHKLLGKSLFQAAIDGTNEVAVSLVSSTATNIVVFLPLLFISGIAQQLFQDLVVVTIFTNVVGLFVAVTLVPRMAAYNWELPALFKNKASSSFILTDKQDKDMGSLYQRLLVHSLDHPMLVVQLVFMSFALSVMILFMWVPRVFMPKMDQGQFIVQLSMPVGTRLEVTNAVASKLEHLLSGFGGVNALVNIGSAQEEEEVDALRAHQAQLVVNVNSKEGGMPTEDVIEKLQQLVKKENLEGGHVSYLLQDSPLRSALAGGAPIEVEIKGPELAKLKSMSDDLVRSFQMNPHLFGVKTTFAVASRETQVSVDKDRAASFQLSVAEIARTALIAIKGIVATEFKQEGKDTDIRVRLRKEDRENSDSIRQLALRSPQGYMVPLDGVAKVSPGLGASEIQHLDQQRACVITAEVTGASVDKAVQEVREIIAPYRSWKDYTVELGGESRRVAESFSSLKYTFILAILLVYMIMASQFESLTQPLIIMTTVPFSFIGVAFTLFLTNTPFSAVVALGIVILAGIVVNNGIVLIDLINSLRQEGMELRKAIIAGSVNRLRPILMTAIVTILGAFPLAIGVGKGDELASPLAVVTFGGMFVSTLLTIVVIPLLYEKLAKWQEAKG